LFEKVGYSNVIQMPINSTFVMADGDPIQVRIPSVEDILGDKLTAYAPNSTGIPYFKGATSMSMEIMKQLYDIGNLFDIAEDGALVKKTFERFAATELAYRNLPEFTIKDVLDDIYQTSLCLVSRGAVGEGDFDQLQEGIRRVSSFIFSEAFQIDRAITFASKAAYLSALIKSDKDVIETYADPAIMKDWTIGDPFWPKLNRLKRTNPEAFFYWYKISELTTV
jgi:hypothetical protein